MGLAATFDAVRSVLRTLVDACRGAFEDFDLKRLPFLVEKVL